MKLNESQVEDGLLKLKVQTEEGSCRNCRIRVR